MSMAMVSTTFGAVAGSNLVDVMGEFASSIGVPTLAGPFILAAAAFILAGLVLLLFLRPHPLIVAKAIANAKEKGGTVQEEAGSKSSTTNKRGIAVGATVMILTQFVMAAIMTMTPLHMGHYSHDLREVGLVIGFHIGAMYLPLLFTGLLVDKVGRTATALIVDTTHPFSPSYI